MTKSEILNKIDSMILYEKDYDTIDKIMRTTSDKFFVKVLEEIFDGSLFLTDFENIFKDDSYSSIVTNNLEQQKKLREEVLRLLYFRKNILGEEFTVDAINTGLVNPGDVNVPDELRDLYNEELDDKRDAIISELFSSLPYDDDLTRASKLRLLNEYNQGRMDIEDLFLFNRSYIIPIDYNHQVITKEDQDFMKIYNLTDNDMRKIKSLSNFIKKEVVIGGDSNG